MKTIIALGGAVLLALLLAAAVQSAVARVTPPTWADLERERLALERAQAVAPAETFAAQALAVFPAVVAYTALGLAAAGGAAALARFLRRMPYVQPDAAGRLPVLLDDQRTAQAALGGFHAARQLEAQRQPVPHSLVYHAPHHRGDGAAGHAAAAEPAVLAPTPSFGELLTAGRVGRGSPLVLGFDLAGGGEVSGSWLDVYSLANAGIPHSGKTTTSRFLACQLALWGAQFIVADPHMEAGDDSLAATLDPLRGIYLAEPASDPKAILEAVRFVEDIGRRRVNGDRDRRPVVLWLDELNGLLQDGTVGPTLNGLLQETARAYRKVGVFISATAHTWTASSTGGSSDLRANFASRMVHRMERGQARNLVPTDLAARAERLEVGQAILHSLRHSTVVQVPNTTAEDVRRVAALLTDDAPTMPRVSASPTARFQPEVSQQAAPDYSAAARGAAPSAEAARVVALFLGGQDAGAIVTTLTGMSSKAGKPYLAKLAEVQGMIREAMRGGGI